MQVKSGVFIRGSLKVDKHRAQEEAWLVLGDNVNVKEISSASKVYVKGMRDRNRAIHGYVWSRACASGDSISPSHVALPCFRCRTMPSNRVSRIACV